jgi:Ca2+-binding EF-hand superfamily protein
MIESKTILCEHVGPSLGPGPLPTTVWTMHMKTRHEENENDDWSFVYDIHGRRHERQSAETVIATSIFDAAMRKVQRIAAKAGRHLCTFFQTYDVNRNGTLELHEFSMALRALDTKTVLTEAQLDALFSFFDRNRTGTIDYGEFLWSFFNRRAFLKRWHVATAHYSTEALKMLFYKHDRLHRHGLTPRHFFLALQELGMAVSELDEALLMHKFDTNGDGRIDFEEFQRAFDTKMMDSDDNVAATNGISHQAKEQRRRYDRSLSSYQDDATAHQQHQNQYPSPQDRTEKDDRIRIKRMAANDRPERRQDINDTKQQQHHPTTFKASGARAQTATSVILDELAQMRAEMDKLLAQ